MVITKYGSFVFCLLNVIGRIAIATRIDTIVIMTFLDIRFITIIRLYQPPESIAKWLSTRMPSSNSGKNEKITLF